MRILITSIVDPQVSAHNRLHELVKYLSRKHEVVIFSIRDLWKARQVDPQLYRSGTEDWLPSVSVNYYLNRPISPIVQELVSIFTIRRLLRKIPPADIHLNYNTLVSGLFTATLLKSKRIRTVYDIADDLPAMIRTSPQIPAFLRPAGGWFAWWMVRCNVRSADKVTLTTEAIPIPNLPSLKRIIVPNGVDTMAFRRMESSALRRQLGLEGNFVVGYVGVLREWVDLSPVLKSLATLHAAGYPVKLLIVGEEGGARNFRSIAEQLGVSDRVLFLGTVAYPEVPRYISCMDVGLIPFKENAVASGAFPLKLFEYMACEIPVISTKIPGVIDVAGDRIFYASTADQLNESIKYILNQPPALKKKVEEGRKLVEERYNWEKIGEIMERILQTTAAPQ